MTGAPGVTIGIDVGGTKIAGGLVSETNQLVLTRRRATVVDGRSDPGLAVTEALVRELVEEAHARGAQLAGIGAGFPEYVAPSGLLTSHEVIAWTIQPIDMLGRLAPVTVESDVRCAALGEAAVGVAHDLPGFIYVIAGTGLSYALLEDGHVRSGARGEAIAFGELEVSRRFSVAGSPTLERFASGEAIRERYAAEGRGAVAGAADVIALAAAGDDVAAMIVRTAGEALGDGLATLVRLIDPGAVVVGGGLSGATGPWREAVVGAYQEGLASRPAPPPVRWSTRRSDVGIIGAAIAHRQRSTSASDA